MRLHGTDKYLLFQQNKIILLVFLNLDLRKKKEKTAAFANSCNGSKFQLSNSGTKLVKLLSLCLHNKHIKAKQKSLWLTYSHYSCLSPLLQPAHSGCQETTDLGDDVLELALTPCLCGVGHDGEDGVVVLFILVVQEDQLWPQVCRLCCP